MITFHNYICCKFGVEHFTNNHLLISQVEFIKPVDAFLCLLQMENGSGKRKIDCGSRQLNKLFYSKKGVYNNCIAVMNTAARRFDIELESLDGKMTLPNGYTFDFKELKTKIKKSTFIGLDGSIPIRESKGRNINAPNRGNGLYFFIRAIEFVLCRISENSFWWRKLQREARLFDENDNLLYIVSKKGIKNHEEELILSFDDLGVRKPKYKGFEELDKKLYVYCN